LIVIRASPVVGLVEGVGGSWFVPPVDVLSKIQPTL